MKASELRIGNWYNVGLTGQEIPQKFELWTEALDFEGYGSPIPLTPEILEKCGFEYVTDWTVRDKRKHDCVTFLDLGYMYLASGMMGGGVTLFQNDRRSTGTNIDYLHQLQTLYLALTGTELEVDISKLQSSPSK